MKKILYFVIWVFCIILLALAYEDYLYSNFKVDSAVGIVEDKGISIATRNIYGNFAEEKQYWIKLNGEKMVVNKSVYDSAQQYKKIKLMITNHGVVKE